MLLFPFFAFLLSQVFAKEFSWMKYFAPDAPIKRGFFEERRSAGKFRAFENLFFFHFSFLNPVSKQKKGLSRQSLKISTKTWNLQTTTTRLNINCNLNLLKLNLFTYCIWAENIQKQSQKKSHASSLSSGRFRFWTVMSP